ncbi:ATP-dependent RNA helicase HrpA [Helcobacillus sp. ACRRO]|uniref:ATP-dependent RNA helicase HrpA n=1 Tax=Helcobacillus sp. ACRRO TaxID=2918202 RepID=UPI001EF41C39|nr:ATP-dependent RNA helicase HrpA [Helcobacillus sp. ACRRO]MCG7426914.1 ATP-dependent RNA helicase HrpA [Helcobacillus sp. ACRRO]
MSTSSSPAPIAITYPSDLPVSERREDIMAAIRDHQIVIIAGETGSGKTTQLPKMCLELGRGANGRLIGHTQPRRIAARSVASRIAHELGEKLGEGTVGYQVRFTKQTARGARLKVMTDGILLSEIQHDRLLKKYDTIIIDEAHERSLTIDMLLGYLKRIARRRPDLKIIITSATIDPERFAAFFSDDSDDPAPILEVSGRTYPVEIRYRPLVLETTVEAENEDEEDLYEKEERSLPQAVCSAVDELRREGPGDILVFLPGEREIREIGDELGKHLAARTRAGEQVQVLPLFGRLSQADQDRIFSPPKNSTTRRIILATNVAETSLTVPGITYVIDSGLARISRYSQRTKVQRLPIEPISQASAQQRSGRSGRTAPGIAIRLFSEEDFAARPEFTEPEILRTSLASVVLQMTALGLGDIERFEFLEKPETRAVRDGIRLLEELHAIEQKPSAPGGRALTPTGRKLARFPLDPRMARMLLEAHDRGALADVLIIVAALSIQDPRERPLEQQEKADQLHRRFADDTSDFLTLLNLWRHIEERRRALSSSALRREIRQEFLHYMRIREWWDLHGQLKQMCRDLDLHTSSDRAGDDAIHQSLLAGLLSHVGLFEEKNRDYQGARGTRFVLWPGSAIAKKRPDYVMAAELVETSRLFGRTAARIRPEWIEELGAHVVKRSYSEPHWSTKRAAAMAYEKVTLYGVPIIAQRAVNLGRIDREQARDTFIQQALIEGRWTTRHHFFRDNNRLIEDLQELEAKTRRRDIIAGDETLFRFYDERLPQNIVSGRHFDSWWKKQRHKTPDLLHFTRDLLLADDAEPAAQGFPDTWVQGDITLHLTYNFDPTTQRDAKQKQRDGVTATVPLAVLGRLEDTGFDWLVPGMREELIIELIRSLPKPLRRHLIPAPDKAKAVAQTLADDDPNTGEKFVEAVADELVALPGVPDDLELYGPEFQTDRLSEHLRMHFRVVDEKGRTVGAGDDLAQLKQRLAGRVRTSAAKQADSFGARGLTAFPDTPIPTTRRSRQGALDVVVYPALVVRTETDGAVRIDLTALPSAQEQAREHPAAVTRLVDQRMRTDSAQILAGLPNPVKLAITQSSYGSAQKLLADASLAATADLVRRTDAAGMVFEPDDFEALVERVGTEHPALARSLMLNAVDALAAHAKVAKAVSRVNSLSVLNQITQLRDHAASLVGERFVSRTPARWLPELPRFEKAALHRVDKMQDNPQKDAHAQWQIQDIEGYWQHAQLKLPAAVRASEAAQDIPWLIEELRVSLFAQQLGTSVTVSDKRIRKAIAELEKS